MARRPAPPGVDRRRQILEAALDAFADEGFDGATTKAIAARAGVTHGLIYFYFPSKDDLFTAACELQASEVLERLDLTVDAEADDAPEVVLRRAIARLVEAVAAPRTSSLFRVINRTYMHGKPCGDAGDEARARMRAFGQRVVQGLRAYLDRQVARGWLRPVDTNLTAQMVSSTIVHFVIRRTLGDEELARYSTDEFADTIANLFLYGLLPQPIPVR